MKYIKHFEIIKGELKIDNLDIINFAKVYNKEKGYSNKAVYFQGYSGSNLGPSKYISVADNPVDNHNYIIVGDLALSKFIKNAKDDGMSNTLYMRALTNKVNEKYGNNKVIIVSIDHNTKTDLTKLSKQWDTFQTIDDKQIEIMMNKEFIIEEGTLSVNRKGKIIDPNKYKDEDYWIIEYKESKDYIFTNFHSGWDILMKENDFINKYMKELKHLLTTQKYNL